MRGRVDKRGDHRKGKKLIKEKMGSREKFKTRYYEEGGGWNAHKRENGNGFVNVIRERMG